MMFFSKLALVSRAGIFSQQVRFRVKSFRYRLDYGEMPLLSEEDWRQAEEDNMISELSYKPIKFALISMSNSPLIDEKHEVFTKHIMKNGDKDLAYNLMRDAFYNIKMIQYKKWKKDPTTVTDPMVIFKTAVENCKPIVITKPVKRGGAIYQVPYPLTEKQSEWFAMKWLRAAVLDRPKPRKKHFPEVMSQELLDAFHGVGKVIKKRDDMHKLADANKAYAHYRWG